MSTFSRELTPLRKPKSSEPFSVCDIESTNWTGFLTIGHFDGLVFRHFERLEEFFDYCFSHTHSVVFAHFGGIFDFLFLLDFILGDERYRLLSLIPRGSGVLSFDVDRIEKGKPYRKITFRDSSALMPFSLKKITESFGVTHAKKEIDYTQIKKVTAELIEYLEYDCKGLWESLEKFYENPLIKSSGAKVTMASQALQVLRTFIKQPIPSCKPSVDDFVRRAYAGGRTEIFKPLYNKPVETLKCFDVNSLYPFVMREEFPTKFDEYSTKLDLERMGFCEVTVKVPQSEYMPILWVKGKKFIFPTGTFSGVWSTIEIKEALLHGAKILAVGTCAYFSNGGPIFREYIDTLYNIRKNSKDEVERTIVKLLMNSTYGRMGLNPQKEGLELDTGQPDVTPHFEFKVGKHTIRFVKTEVTLETFSNVAIAAWVTALARIHMHRLMKPIQNEVWYMDTDSIFTPIDLGDSKELGMLKKEYEVNQACFLLPKTYIAGEKIAMKGFDKKKIQHFTFADFESALEGDLKMMRIQTDAKMSRLKTAMRNKTLLHLGNKSSRQLKSLYDKRLLIKSTTGEWSTKAIHLKS